MKKVACNDLLEFIKLSLRSVTTQAPDWKDLECYWTLRQIYTPTNVYIDVGEKIKITRRLELIIIIIIIIIFKYVFFVPFLNSP